MSMKTKVGYAAGHIFNDIVAAFAFSYSLLFFQSAIQISKTSAGIIFLVGQIADAISTGITGIMSDVDTNSQICAYYGRRKV